MGRRMKPIGDRKANQKSITDYLTRVEQRPIVNNTNNSQEILVDRGQQNNDQRRSDEDEKYRPADSAGSSSGSYHHDQSAPSGSDPLDLRVKCEAGPSQIARDIEKRSVPEIQAASSSFESTADNQQNVPYDSETCSENIYVYDCRESTYLLEDVFRNLRLFCNGIENEHCSIEQEYGIAAFKINVPTKFKEAALNKNNWPDSVWVREWSNPLPIQGTLKADCGRLHQKTDGHKTSVKHPEIDNKCMIRMFYQNVNGLLTKTDEFYSNVRDCTHDVIIGTETGLNSSVNNAQLFPARYTVIRRDRVGYKGRRGIFIAAKKELSLTEVTDVEGTKDKLLITMVERDNTKFLLCAVYLPPAYNEYIDILVCLHHALQKYAELDVFIIGDFNLYSNGKEVLNVYNFFKECWKLKNFNPVLNRLGRILDLVLTNVDPDRVKVTDTVDKLVVPKDRNHTPFMVTLRSE